MAKAKNDDTDLLGGLGADEAEVVDLLDGIDEGDDAEPWMPEEAGEGIQGTVLRRSVTKSDYTPEPIPVITLETGKGKVRVTGFQSVLRREIEEADPQPGDTFAARYFGQKTTKNGTGKYHHFKVAVRRGQAPAGSGSKAAPF